MEIKKFPKLPPSLKHTLQAFFELQNFGGFESTLHPNPSLSKVPKLLFHNGSFKKKAY